MQESVVLACNLLTHVHNEDGLIWLLLDLGRGRGLASDEAVKPSIFLIGTDFCLFIDMCSDWWCHGFLKIS